MKKVDSNQLDISVDSKKIVEILSPDIKKKLEELISDLRLPETYLTRKETAKLLNISLPTLDKYTTAGYLDKWILS